MITFDTGALIALERRRGRMRDVAKAALKLGAPVFIPSVVLAEWWRGTPREQMRDLLSAARIVPIDENLARIAGEAMAVVPQATTIDALVMATAALRGSLVYTSDFDDLSRLATHFRMVKVLSV